jgi:tetratricopeptide (TPR) repeat protein
MTDPASSPDDNLEIIAQLRNELAEKDRLQRALVGVAVNFMYDMLKSRRGEEKVSWFRHLFSRFSAPEESKMPPGEQGWKEGNFDDGMDIDDLQEKWISQIRQHHEIIEKLEELVPKIVKKNSKNRDFNNANTYFLLGRMNYNLGNYDAAEKWWREGVRIQRDLGEPIDQVFIDKRY